MAMSIGERMRQAREERNVSLHAIAEKTNISVRFLDALEKGHIDKLPGGIFIRGFVRSYAAQVGLDPDKTVQEFVAAHPQARHDSDPADPERRVGAPSGVVLILGLLAATVALGGGLYWWLASGGPAPAPARGTPTSQLPAGQLPSSPPASDTVASTAPATANTGPAAAGPAESTSPSVASAPAPVEEVPASTRPLRLTVTPTGRCWVQVKADGRVRLAREMQQGERVDIGASELLEIVTGDAGAFGYQLNGQPGRSLGSPGSVARVSISMADVARYQDVAR